MSASIQRQTAEVGTTPGASALLQPQTSTLRLESLKRFGSSDDVHARGRLLEGDESRAPVVGVREHDGFGLARRLSERATKGVREAANCAGGDSELRGELGRFVVLIVIVIVKVEAVGVRRRGEVRFEIDVWSLEGEGCNPVLECQEDSRLAVRRVQSHGREDSRHCERALNQRKDDGSKNARCTGEARRN